MLTHQIFICKDAQLLLLFLFPFSIFSSFVILHVSAPFMSRHPSAAFFILRLYFLLCFFSSLSVFFRRTEHTPLLLLLSSLLLPPLVVFQLLSPDSVHPSEPRRPLSPEDWSGMAVKNLPDSESASLFSSSPEYDDQQTVKLKQHCS